MPASRRLISLKTFRGTEVDEASESYSIGSCTVARPT